MGKLVAEDRKLVILTYVADNRTTGGNAGEEIPRIERALIEFAAARKGLVWYGRHSAKRRNDAGSRMPRTRLSSSANF